MAIEFPAGTIPARGFDWDAVVFPPRRVGDFADLAYGKGLVEGSRMPGNVPVFGTNGRCGWHDSALQSGPGIILGRKGQGPLGVEWCDEPFWVIDTAYVASVIQSEVDLKWFYYVTKYVGLNHLKTGEKPGLQRDTFRAQLFPFPEKSTQSAIASVLGSVDEKIHANHRTNDALEALASVLFERLMVAIDDDAALETSVQSLIDRQLLVVGDGYRAKNEELASAGLPFARAGNIDAGFLFADTELLGWPAVMRAGIKISVPFDVVFTSKGTVGRFAFVSPMTPKFAYSPQLCFWRSVDHDVLSPFFLYHWMRSSRFLEQVDAVKGQTDMADYVSLTDQRSMRMACPKAGEHRRLRDEVATLWDLHFANTDESKTLTALRDALLPKLLSGEVRLKQAENMVEAAL